MVLVKGKKAGRLRGRREWVFVGGGGGRFEELWARVRRERLR